MISTAHIFMGMGSVMTIKDVIWSSSSAKSNVVNQIKRILR